LTIFKVGQSGGKIEKEKVGAACTRANTLKDRMKLENVPKAVVHLPLSPWVLFSFVWPSTNTAYLSYEMDTLEISLLCLFHLFSKGQLIYTFF
jgi:hypothetical protein